MVRPLAHTPGWLSRPSPGFDLFQPNSTTSKTEAQHTEGRRRCIAHRGNEVFVAVGNELRWSNVGLLRDAGADAADNGQRHGHERAHRVLKVPGYRDITELSVSPDGTWIAILTSHTCHVAILPTPSHLHANDFSPLRLKSYQIGPSAHVLEQSPLVRSLWHPLAPSDNVLVTVTQDACVRMWELNSDNRATFSEPSLAVDLKKLNNAASSQADFSASKYGTNKGFSADDVQMETAAACFGGQGSEDEHGWSGMTLWVAMTEGDVYALCPFLPSKWRAPASLLPSLSTSVVASARATAHDPECSESEKRTSDQQCRWLADIDDQDPTSQYDEAGAVYAEIYNRPSRPGPVPKLQGPFALAPEPNFGEITDIHVIAPKLDEEALFGDDDDSEATVEGLSAGVICLAASTQQVHICLDLEGVGAEWLPAKRSRGYTYDDEEEKELIVLETVDLARSDEPAECWPTFTKSPISKHEFFVSLPEGVSSLAISPWATSLESELSSEITEGIGFRLKQLLDNAKTTVDEPISMFADPNEQPNTAIALIDPSLGYFLLTTASDEPHAAILDIPDVQDPFAPDELDHQVVAPAIEPREPYQAAHVFFEASQLPSFITNARKRAASKSVDPDARLKFTPEVLELMAEAHRVLSNETHRLGLAAADIFRRCERMRSELREQVRKVQEMSQKVDAVTGEEYGQNGDDSEERMGREKTAAAIEETRAKNTRLNERVESLRRRMLKLGDGQLSNKEAQFLEEVDKINTAIGQRSGDDKDAPVGPDQILHMDNSRSSSLRRSTGPPKTEKMAGSLSTRFEQAEELCKSLARQAAEVSQHQVEGAERSQQAQSGDRYRRQALAQVMNLLERETALMDATSLASDAAYRLLQDLDTPGAGDPTCGGNSGPHLGRPALTIDRLCFGRTQSLELLVYLSTYNPPPTQVQLFDEPLQTKYPQTTAYPDPNSISVPVAAMATTFRDNFKYLPQPAECLAILIGCAELSIFGLAGLANPSAFIQNYGLPAITAAPKTNSQILDAKSSQATKDADVRQAYIAAIAARNMQNGICLLAFACYWRDRRALGTVVASAVVTTFADWMIVRWYGVKEAEFGHVIGVVNSTAIGASLLYWVGEAWY